MRFISIILFFFLLISCEEIINVDLANKNDKILILEGGITNVKGRINKIKLSYSMSYYDSSSTPMATGATLSISDSLNEFLLVEKDPGIYETDSFTFHAEVGKTYTLHISLPNGEQYEASEKMKPVMHIDSILYSYEQNLFSDQRHHYSLLLYGQELPEEGDYYQWNLILNDTLMNDSLHEENILSDQFFNGQYLPGYEIFRIGEKRLNQDINHVTVEELSVSENYYNFRNEVMMQTEWNGGLFSTPPANINICNIKPINHTKQAFGYFKVSAVTSYSFILDRRIKITIPGVTR